MSVEEKRIREFAYQIWESEGQPEGQQQRHWEMARKLAEAEALAPRVTPRKPSAKAKPASAAAAPKKPRAAKKPPTA
ncbi:DUF2934 domain-containing protein [Pseudomonas rubra]|uniref:DUF2934 domain-containing protein n=1 Tax=Pseudomonas rubra TaxID=2942627 RepID=A0ABT5PB21_9PSED|nr:DUF2934 domain-containing protein [Pseudomonas rubra]MDD1015139.1 DUF2934 domain-containing protein [Pseudomonas rubra]MDD1037718.1 DUF2934 domain-containing protein [Pseudomonas rubra]MDD1157362.1 DUF2934 domain-containing protein [Pseudomonas rubra]